MLWRYVYNSLSNSIICYDTKTGAWSRPSQTYSENRPVLVVNDEDFLYTVFFPHDKPGQLVRVNLDNFSRYIPMHLEPQTS